MESMIKDLQAQVDALKGCPINDVLRYIMENSNTMDCTIADDVCPMADMPMAPSGSGMASKSGYSKSGGSYMPSASGYSKSGYSKSGGSYMPSASGYSKSGASAYTASGY